MQHLIGKGYKNTMKPLKKIITIVLVFVGKKPQGLKNTISTRIG